jgi:hypothetical protein
MSIVITNPGEYDIHLYSDRDFKLRLNTTTVSGSTFEAQIRSSVNTPTVLADFNIEVNEVDNYLELSLDSTDVSSLINSNIINLGSISTTVTYAWDLQITNDVGNTFNLINGNCYIHRTVTKGE